MYSFIRRLSLSSSFKQHFNHSSDRKEYSRRLTCIIRERERQRQRETESERQRNKEPTRGRGKDSDRQREENPKTGPIRKNAW